MADPKFAMGNGSYPISSCEDVRKAADLAHHSKTYSFEEVKAHVMKAKNALDCGDDVLPATWKTEESAAQPSYKGEVMPVQIASAGNGASRYAFRGVASTIGTVDRMRRCFLPGAWGSAKFKVPLLWGHVDNDPNYVLGSSALTPKGNTLRHESSLNPKAVNAATLQALIDDGDIPSTSISWFSNDQYFGWTDLQRRSPDKAKEAAGLGIEKAEDITYFAKATVVENSVVVVPANEHALIGVASLLSAERGMVDSMRDIASLALEARETAAGARNSQRDQGALQRAHDALIEAGATCSQEPGSDASDAAETPGEPGVPKTDLTELKGGFVKDIRTPDNASLATDNGTDSRVVLVPNSIDDVERQLAELEASLPGRNSSD